MIMSVKSVQWTLSRDGRRNLVNCEECRWRVGDIHILIPFAMD